MTDQQTGEELPPTEPRQGRLSTLISTVDNLDKSVRVLSDRLRDDYPTKKEVDKKRRWTVTWAILFVVGIIFVACFTTISAVSYCFLQPNGPHSACGLLPGYNVSVDARARYYEQQSALQDLIQKNQEQLATLQREVEALQAQNPGG